MPDRCRGLTELPLEAPRRRTYEKGTTRARAMSGRRKAMPAGGFCGGVGGWWNDEGGTRWQKDKGALDLAPWRLGAALRTGLIYVRLACNKVPSFK